MDNSALVDVADDGGVVTLTLQRPERGNALDLPTTRALADALERVHALPGRRALVVRGAGAHFCVGGDAVAMGAADHPQDWVDAVVTEAHRAVRALVSLDVVVVAAVQGAAAGAGLGLALAADLVVCAASSRFVPAYAGIGLTPDAGVSWLLSSEVGQQRAAAMLLSGLRLDGTTALAWGLAHDLVPEERVQARAHELAVEVAGRAHGALGRTRLLARAAWDHDLDTHLDREAAQIVAARGESEPWLRAFLAR